MIYTRARQDNTRTRKICGVVVKKAGLDHYWWAGHVENFRAGTDTGTSQNKLEDGQPRIIDPERSCGP